jgi:hypothetical protein
MSNTLLVCLIFGCIYMYCKLIMSSAKDKKSKKDGIQNTNFDAKAVPRRS